MSIFISMYTYIQGKNASRKQCKCFVMFAMGITREHREEICENKLLVFNLL